MPTRFESRIAGMTAEAYWQALVGVGWLEGVPPSLHARLGADVRAAFAEAPALAWTALAAIAFDGECIEGVAPDPLSYAVHLQQIAEATHGVFQPTRIIDRRDGSAIVIALSYPGQTYEMRVDARSDAFSPRVIDFVNDTLAREGLRGRLAVLPALDQTVAVAVARPETLRRAQAEGLLPMDRDLVARRL